jgi:hypothetical protein
MNGTRARRLDRLKLPPPEVSWWLLAWFGGIPRNTPTLLELDDVIFPDVRPLGRHSEHFTDRSDALPASGLGQVVVAIPAWLLSRVRNQLKDTLGTCGNLASCANDALTVFFASHLSMKALRRPGGV